MKVAVAIFGLFYLFGLAMLGYAGWSAWKSAAAARWPRTKGTVTRCELRNQSGSKGGVTYRVEVEYTYDVARRSYTGDRIAYGYAGSSDYRAHHELYQALRNAKQVDVRYDPANPGSSTLSYGVHGSIRMLLAFSVVWLGFTLGMTLLIWMSRASGDDMLLRNLLVY